MMLVTKCGKGICNGYSADWLLGKTVRYHMHM